MQFIADPRRDAYATIAGFVYQVNVTVLRWISLQSGQFLELECGEDIDTVSTSDHDDRSTERRLLEQLKVRSTQALTLRSPEALEALCNFCEHRRNNPETSLNFRFLTTANAGVEQGWILPDGGIDTWMILRRGEYGEEERAKALTEIRTLFRNAKRPDRSSNQSWNAFQDIVNSDDAFSELIASFEWALGYGDPQRSEEEVLAALVNKNHVISKDDGSAVYEHLFAFVFRLLTRPGPKILTIETLSEELNNPSIPLGQRGILNALKHEIEQVKEDIAGLQTSVSLQHSELSTLKQTVALINQSYGFANAFGLSAENISTDLPELVSPRAERLDLITHLLSTAEAGGALFLVGEPGSGKTQVLRMAIERTTRKPIWLNIQRGATGAEACVLIESLVRMISPNARGTSLRERYGTAMKEFKESLVVIDDLPRLLPGGPLIKQLEVLSDSLRTVNSILFVSSYYDMPASAADNLQASRHELPRFVEDDVQELLTVSGAPEPLQAQNICRLLVTISEGLPVLVMAAVRYLINHQWNLTILEMESLFRGEFATGYRQDANSLLQITTPDVQERELLIRMSVAMGPFSLKDIARVANVPKAIPLPGEKVQRAKGLWLQELGNDQFLRSPLITSEVSSALDPETRKGVHYVFALGILAKKSLTPIDVLTCVHHLTMAEDMNFACIVLIQAMASMLELEDKFAEDFGLLRLSVATVLASKVDINLRLYLCALQIVVLIKQDKEIDSMLATMDGLLQESDVAQWGTSVASGTLAIYLVWKQPALANQYLLRALAAKQVARLPDGTPIPRPKIPLEEMLWMSAYSAKSDEEAESWLIAVQQLSSEQVNIIKKSEMMEDNVTIFCDGYWRRQYLNPEYERNWSHVDQSLNHVREIAHTIKFDVLEAASIRTQIMLWAELILAF